ncbi:putative lipoprotein [Marinobacter nitratireducens]|uniref:Putative lipoprotein n=1 Tax=Marinobacter nitratireducens TaxID=1137280 RepID=A0A072NFE7_9GAMM|nr:putative zinc-binding protein [Marinobacter nitratireducens]KEF31830.1 putative lipoprotein [Marinobacter nitratireducens]TNE98092.1 MAG: zinc-binding protein [Gammaproteobacteria bacterium]
MKPRKQRPLIYACSGCSDVAQLANNAAVALDHAGEFEMSCISGVGGKVPALVKVAQSGRPITVIDGCPLHCAKSCLENIGVQPEDHVRLYEYGFKKHYGQSYGSEAVDDVCDEVRNRFYQHQLIARQA